MLLSRRLWFFVLAVLLASCLVTAFLWQSNLLPAPLGDPYIVRAEPAAHATGIIPTSPITLTFSAPMDRLATESAVRVFPPIRGQLAWRNNQTLVFTPDARLPISRTLTVSVASTARSQLQRPLANAFVTEFTTLAYPAVVASTPTRAARFVYTPNQIALTFDRAMDRQSVLDHLTLSPPVE